MAGAVYRGVGHEANLCDGSIEVDYKGDEVMTEDNIFRPSECISCLRIIPTKEKGRGI